MASLTITSDEHQSPTSSSPRSTTRRPKRRSGGAHRCSIRRTFSGDGSIRQTLSGIFQSSPAKDGADKTTPRRTTSLPRGCSLKLLMCASTTEAVVETAEHSDSENAADASITTSGTVSNSNTTEASTKRRLPRRSRSAPKSKSLFWEDNDECAKAIDEMEVLQNELLAMARILGKVEDPQKILLKHMKPNSTHNSAA